MVLSLNLQMDMNFCASLMTYLSSDQQSTNGDHPDQLIDHTKHKRLVIIHTLQFVMQLCMYFTWQPVDSYQLEIINFEKKFFI